MATIIDKSEKLQLLTVAPLDTLTIERDSGTPKREHEIHVTTKGLALGLGATILIQDHAELNLHGVASADLLGTIDIGNDARLYLNSSIGLGILNSIQFTNTQGNGYLQINAADVNLTGSVTGFGVNDKILLSHLGAVSSAWTQSNADGGTLALYNAAGTEVDSIGLNGEYTNANFTLRESQNKHGIDVTRITFVAQDTMASPAAHGFTLPSAHADTTASAAQVFGSLKGLQAAETAALQFVGGLAHHS